MFIRMTYENEFHYIIREKIAIMMLVETLHATSLPNLFWIIPDQRSFKRRFWFTGHLDIICPVDKFWDNPLKESR